MLSDVLELNSHNEAKTYSRKSESNRWTRDHCAKFGMTASRDSAERLFSQVHPIASAMDSRLVFYQMGHAAAVAERDRKRAAVRSRRFPSWLTTAAIVLIAASAAFFLGRAVDRPDAAQVVAELQRHPVAAAEDDLDFVVPKVEPVVDSQQTSAVLTTSSFVSSPNHWITWFGLDNALQRIAASNDLTDPKSLDRLLKLVSMPQVDGLGVSHRKNSAAPVSPLRRSDILDPNRDWSNES